jgi:hypothetical protein
MQPLTPSRKFIVFELSRRAHTGAWRMVASNRGSQGWSTWRHGRWAALEKAFPEYIKDGQLTILYSKEVQNFYDWIGNASEPEIRKVHNEFPNSTRLDDLLTSRTRGFRVHRESRPVFRRF